MVIFNTSLVENHSRENSNSDMHEFVILLIYAPEKMSLFLIDS